MTGIFSQSTLLLKFLPSRIYHPVVFRAAEEPGNKSWFSPAEQKVCWLAAEIIIMLEVIKKYSGTSGLQLASSAGVTNN